MVMQVARWQIQLFDELNFEYFGKVLESLVSEAAYWQKVHKDSGKEFHDASHKRQQQKAEVRLLKQRLGGAETTDTVIESVEALKIMKKQMKADEDEQGT